MNLRTIVISTFKNGKVLTINGHIQALFKPGEPLTTTAATLRILADMMTGPPKLKLVRSEICDVCDEPTVNNDKL